jgi:hypothetical protein
MSIDNFIRTAWAAKLLENMNGAQVYAACLNRDYEGEIKATGDTVKINSIGRITIVTYTKNLNNLTPQILQDSQMMLAITQSDAFCFEIDDVDKAQSNVTLMNSAMEEAAWGMADTADLWLAALLAAGVATANVLTPVTVGTGATDKDAYEVLVDLGVRLTANSVPRTGRWVVIPAWYEGLLDKDPRFVSFGTPENRRQLVGGEPIGAIKGMEVMVSNNVPVAGSAYTVVAGTKQAATYAENLEKVEAFRPQGGFADAMKGLHLYGAKVTRPYALASVVATAA